jgi:hypothetical protein
MYIAADDRLVISIHIGIIPSEIEGKVVATHNHNVSAEVTLTVSEE